MKWRQLAWATPEVWTSWIYINHKVIYRWDSNAAKLLTEWLECSATLLLTIRFVGPSNGDLAVYCVVMDLLKKYSAQWYDIHLDIPVRHFNRLGGSPQQNILHKLVISPSISSNKVLLTFRIECSLIELGLMDWSLKYIDILWNNLTVVQLASLALDEFFEALWWAPHWATITLLCIEPLSGNFSVPNTRISCPHVCLLELRYIESEVLGQILNSVCLPSLEQWTLRRCLFPLNAMISFIESSSFRLKTFWIIGDHDTHDWIHDLLHCLPSIEVLQLGFTFEDKPATTILFLSCYVPPARPISCLTFKHWSLNMIYLSCWNLYLKYSAHHTASLCSWRWIITIFWVLRTRLQCDSSSWSMKDLTWGLWEMGKLIWLKSTGFILHSQRKQGLIAQE